MIHVLFPEELMKSKKKKKGGGVPGSVRLSKC